MIGFLLLAFRIAAFIFAIVGLSVWVRAVAYQRLVVVAGIALGAGLLMATVLEILLGDNEDN